MDEDPIQYFARISTYIKNSAASEGFVTLTNEERATFNTKVTEKLGGENQVEIQNHVNDITVEYGKMWARRIQNFHIRHVWLNGLLQPYSDIARAQDTDKNLGALLDKVQDEGAVRIHRATHKDHALSLIHI